MTDFETRRSFVALTLIEGLQIVVNGEVCRSCGTEGVNGLKPRDRVLYQVPDDRPRKCLFPDISFDYATLTAEHRAEIEHYELERQQTFAGMLRKKLHTYTFDTFREDEGNRHALERCKDLELGQNLFIHGPPGTGKTMLATATARDASRYYSAAFWSTVELFTVIRSSFGRGATKERPDLDRVEFLVLDDLDKVRSTDFVYEELYALINNRYENELTTIFTANHRPLATATKVSGDPDNAYALMSRIASGDVVEIAGRDARVLQGRGR